MRKEKREYKLKKDFKKKIKTFLGILFYKSGLYRIFFRKKAVVTLFHRVCDTLDDDQMTCSAEEFRSFCDFFQKFFNIISLGDLIRKIGQNEDISRCLAITFDDGYKDNFNLAAAELKKRNLPACFFVTTNFIGSSYIAPWDRQYNIKSEWMNWDDLLSLQAQGFEIGSHTMNHVDLGLIKGGDAFREIADSKKELEMKLKNNIQHFSYPFGGIDNITKENLELISKAGYISCASAYGGIIDSKTNPFFIRRVAVTRWFNSPYQLGFELIYNILWRWRHDKLFDMVRRNSL